MSFFIGERAVNVLHICILLSSLPSLPFFNITHAGRGNVMLWPITPHSLMYLCASFNLVHLVTSSLSPLPLVYNTRKDSDFALKLLFMSHWTREVSTGAFAGGVEKPNAGGRMMILILLILDDLSIFKLKHRFTTTHAIKWSHDKLAEHFTNNFNVKGSTLIRVDQLMTWFSCADCKRNQVRARQN